MTQPSLGDLLFLASYVFRVNVTAVTTMPDTPNQYSAQLQVMGDAGEMDLSALVGPTGPPGVADFVLRDQTDVIIVNNVFDLPALTDTYNDIGKYWRLDTLDQYGHTIMETAYIWYGAEYRAFMMGSFGPPGPVPSISPSCQTIAPGDTSYVETTGPTFQPSWIFQLAIPAGPVGPKTPVSFFPDVDVAGVNELTVLTAVSYLNTGGLLWKPLQVDAGLFAPYSMAEDQFQAYDGFSTRAPIGSFVIPPQPFPWTPLVWGHIGGVGGQGAQGLLSTIINALGDILAGGLSASPFTIGCDVLLGDPSTGIQVGMGFGNDRGVVNIYPDYTSHTNNQAAITPTNNLAVVPANHTGNEGTLYVSLYNYGMNDLYHFTPGDAQLFIAVIPINAPFATITTEGGGGGGSGVPRLHAHGALTAKYSVLGTAEVTAALSADGSLHATAFPV